MGNESVHKELEMKWKLSEADYRSLHKLLPQRFGDATELIQENRFFDTADRLLRQQLMSLRLRLENERLLLTVKQRLADEQGDGIHRQQETEAWLDPSLWAGIDDGSLAAEALPLPAVVIEAARGQPLVSLGGFGNQRLGFTGENGDEICLDRTRFPGDRVDFELEVECADPAEAHPRWLKQLADWNIGVRPQGQTKLHRYLEALAGSGD